MAYRETDKVRAKKLARHQALLRSGEALVREGGFAALTIQALADRVGVGVGTLYRYFKNKDDLATEVFRIATQRELAAVASAFASEGDEAERLAKGVHCFVARALEAPRLAWALIAEPVDPKVDEARLQYRGDYTRLFAALLEEGNASGRFDGGSPALMAAALVGALAESVLGPLKLQQNQEKVIAELVAFSLRAVGASQPEDNNG